MGSFAKGRLSTCFSLAGYQEAANLRLRGPRIDPASEVFLYVSPRGRHLPRLVT